MTSTNRGFQKSLLHDLFPQLPTLTSDYVNRVLTPHYPLLLEMVMEPWRDFVRRRSNDRCFTNLSEEQAAIWLTMQANNHAKDLFTKDCYRVVTTHRKETVVIDEKLEVTVKKLTRRLDRTTNKWVLTRSNSLTQRNQRYGNQQNCEDTNNYPRIFLGYELLDEVTRISPMIAYPRSRRRAIEWAIPIPAQEVAPAVRFHKPEAGGITEEGKGYSIGSTAEAGKREGTSSEKRD